MTKAFFGETGPIVTPPVTASIPVQSDDAKSDRVEASENPGGRQDRAEQDEPGDHPPRATAPQGAREDRAMSDEHLSAPPRQVRRARSQDPVAADAFPARYDDASVRRIFSRGSRASA